MLTQHGYISVASDRLPVVDITYHAAISGDHFAADFRESLGECARLARRGEPLVYLIDMRDFDPLRASPQVRREAAHIFLLYADRLLPVSVGEARIITNPLTRNLVTAFDWLTSASKWPSQHFASLETGERWLRGLLPHWKPRPPR